MDADASDAAAAADAAAAFEMELFLQMVVLMRLIDGGKVAEAVECSGTMFAKIRACKSRSSTGDEIVAKCFFYYSRAFELQGKKEYSSIRNALHAALRTATLRSDEPGQLHTEAPTNLSYSNHLQSSVLCHLNARKDARPVGRAPSMYSPARSRGILEGNKYPQGKQSKEKSRQKCDTLAFFY